ncbi:DUF3034 family protein [Niveibacterium umoris]|uniref:DUF3034 domain-containing protein n=1 Tax=Niveibacterium umoris TaxID=1193620 RepID=A0A840BG55_9RHOO|nr:DUF3034 family protein [Niveibacterium umoris]MBB4012521.1 hypothetical protein [Niveibacterium umoris]
MPTYRPHASAAAHGTQKPARAVQRLTALIALSLSFSAHADLTLGAAPGARLTATGGVSQIEGSGGGGLVPWALISGYASADQIGGSAFVTRVDTGDFRLDSGGGALGIGDRVELSYALQRFDLGTTVPGASIRMDIVGAKIRLAGDAVYDQDRWLPQLALGVQYKHNRDFDFVPKALGANRGDDWDAYLAASKVWIDGPFGRSLLANLTLRATRANQLGLLGFGGDKSDAHRIEPEASLGLFLRDDLVLGAEYRAKPDNLSAFREDAFADVFVAWFPSKRLSITAAWTDLGNIADKPHQQGAYLSLQIAH